MISSTTLILASLVFNAVSVFGAPIRIPDAPSLAVRAEIDEPILPRVVVVDAQPEHKRSVQGTGTRPRLAREIAPEHASRDTASPEPVDTRDSLPEIEQIVRRYPRRALFEFYEKREPVAHKAPQQHSPPVEARQVPDAVRRYPRRVYHDFYEKRSEPAQPEVRSEITPEPELLRRYPRRVYAEYYEKRSAPTDNVPREPAPAPEAAPAPAPEPEPAPAKVEQPERRHFPRRVYAEYYEKRQDNNEPPANETPAEASPSASTTATSTATSTPTAETTVSATSTPSNLDFNKVIADAIVKTSSNAKQETPNGKINSFKDTTITIKITQQENTDNKLEAPPAGAVGSSANTVPNGQPSPSPSPSPTGTGAAADGGNGTPPEASPSPSATSTSTASSSAPTGTGSVSTDSSGDGADASSTDGSGGATESRRDLGSDSAPAAAVPVKRGLSSALWATWSRRNFMN